MKEQSLFPSHDDAGKRVDKYLSEQLVDFTRNAIQGLLEDKKISINDKPIKKNYKLVGGEELRIFLPEVKTVDIIAQEIPLDIVYEDEDIIIVNKARGMVVHPAAGNWDGTLVNALMFHCGARLSGINGELRPGIVHRIDKDTSGLLVVAKNDMAHQGLAAQIQAHSVRREYEAIVCGTMREDAGTIDKPIGRSNGDRKKMAVTPEGRQAITHFQVIARFNGYTQMAFQLETGRTHQIRVHMASVGHPIIGDPLYGYQRDRYAGIGGQCLHAGRLTLEHPRSHESMVFTAPKPDYFEEILQRLKRNI